jgi:HipA-like protein
LRFTPLYHKGPPPTLQIFYQGQLVAELSKQSDAGKAIYAFKYLPAFKEMNLAPLPGIPFSEQDLKSQTLWAFFSERIPDERRPEIKAWIKLKGLEQADDLRILAEMGAHSVTDPFEIRSAA